MFSNNHIKSKSIISADSFYTIFSSTNNLKKNKKVLKNYNII